MTLIILLLIYFVIGICFAKILYKKDKCAALINDEDIVMIICVWPFAIIAVLLSKISDWCVKIVKGE